jgi:protein SCO1
MSKGQKILTMSLWGLTVVALVALIASGVGPRWHRGETATTVRVETLGELPAFYVPAFSLTDQDGKTITQNDLRGEIWIADFIFTRCPGPCPLMSAKMASLQERIPSDVKLVSFTMDPKNDTPSVLKEYGAKYAADFSRWSFLTGDRDKIVEVAMGLKLPTEVGATPVEIVHSEKFVLVDGEGKARGYYHGTTAEQLDKLVRDARELLERPAPQGPAK